MPTNKKKTVQEEVHDDAELQILSDKVESLDAEVRELRAANEQLLEALNQQVEDGNAYAEYAQAEIRRLRTLVASGSISPSDRKAAEAALRA